MIENFISKEQIRELLNDMDNEMSMQELSMWLKSQTDDEWVVVPKAFCDLTIQLFNGDFSAYFRSKIDGFEEALENINSIKKYL